MHLTRKRISKNCHYILYGQELQIPARNTYSLEPENVPSLASIEECSVFSVLYVPLIVVLQRYVWRIKLKEINLGHSTKGESAPTTLAFNQNIEENKFVPKQKMKMFLSYSAKSGCFYGCQSIFSHMACVRPVIVSLWIELVQLLHPPPHTQSHTRYIFFNWLQLLLPQQQSISSAKQ